MTVGALTDFLNLRSVILEIKVEYCILVDKLERVLGHIGFHRHGEVSHVLAVALLLTKQALLKALGVHV